MLSLLILGLAFLPFLPYDIAFLALLVGRYFFHPKMQDLALSLLIQIILLDIFFFLSKKKSIFFLLLFSLLLLLLHGSYDPMDTGVTLKRLLPMAGDAPRLLFLVLRHHAEGANPLLFQIIMNVLLILCILKDVQNTFCFCVFHFSTLVFLLLLSKIRGQPLSQVLNETKEQMLALFLLFLSLSPVG